VQAVLVLYLWAAVVALGVVSFAFVNGWLPIVIIILVVIFATALTLWLPKWVPNRRL
jgi:UDP-GlcNAc:undecaprenyl-phosphate GlcNAc-1-phosphate transferase